MNNPSEKCPFRFNNPDPDLSFDCIGDGCTFYDGNRCVIGNIAFAINSIVEPFWNVSADCEENFTEPYEGAIYWMARYFNRHFWHKCKENCWDEENFCKRKYEVKDKNDSDVA